LPVLEGVLIQYPEFVVGEVELGEIGLGEEGVGLDFPDSVPTEHEIFDRVGDLVAGDLLDLIERQIQIANPGLEVVVVGVGG
jgi:hypothetical protein